MSATLEFLLDARGEHRALDAHVVAIAWHGATPAFALGDGTVRLGWRSVSAHDGAVLALAATPDGFVTGGTTGRCSASRPTAARRRSPASA